MSVIFLVVLMKFRISFGKGFIFYGFQVAFKCSQEKYQLICRWCKTPNNKFSVLWFGHIQCLTEPRNSKTIFFSELFNFGANVHFYFLVQNKNHQKI